MISQLIIIRLFFMICEIITRRYC